MRLLVLTEIPAPFRIPGFNALAAMPDVELHVVVVAEHDPRRAYAVDPSQFDFDYHVLRGANLNVRGRWVAFNRGFARLLRRIEPDVVVIGGWNQPVFWQALVAARRAGSPSVLWVESTARDARVGTRAAHAVRRAALRLASAFIVPGRAAGEYLEELGVDRRSITIAPNAVEHGIATSGAEREAARTQLGVAGCVFLYVGRLEREKGPDIAVRAMHDAPGTLVVVGDGSMRAALEGDAPQGRVIFAGLVPRNGLARWYAAADALVFPSRSDTWGMVLNEAASAGLPLIASTVAGGAYDLIEPGVNGHLFPPADTHALSQLLQQVDADPAWRAAAGRRSRELAEGFTPEAWATAVAEQARGLRRTAG